MARTPDQASRRRRRRAAERGGAARSGSRRSCARCGSRTCSCESVVSLAQPRGAADRQGGRARPRAGAGSGSRPCARSSTCSTDEPARRRCASALSELQMLYARGTRAAASRRRAAATARGAGARRQPPRPRAAAPRRGAAAEALDAARRHRRGPVVRARLPRASRPAVPGRCLTAFRPLTEDLT